MTGKRGRSDDGERFAELIDGVKPLADTPEAIPVRPPRPPVPRPEPSRAATPFQIERQGEGITGLAQGVDRRHLIRIRRGEATIEERIDLHGLGPEEARRAVTAGLEGARTRGVRCVLVVHGRGLHSREEAVLRPALIQWLTRAPLDAQILAFASALPRDGGAGATYVLLRRAPRARSR